MASEEAINKLSLGTVRCIREVLLQKSVSLAADRLGVTQSAVSQKIARFEKYTGIRIVSRTGNAISVREDEIATLIFAMVAAQDELVRLAQDQPRRLPRLGICDCLGAFYCRNDGLYAALSETYALHVARPSILMDLYLRSELDVVVRPLFHHESETELMTTVPIEWVSAQPENGGTGSSRTDEAINVILESSMSPYSHYVRRQLEELQVPYKVLARIDDHPVRLHLVASRRGYAAIPGFLKSVLPDGIRPLRLFEQKSTIRLGLIFNNRKLTFNTAISLFDTITAQISVSPVRTPDRPRETIEHRGLPSILPRRRGPDRRI